MYKRKKPPLHLADFCFLFFLCCCSCEFFFFFFLPVLPPPVFFACLKEEDDDFLFFLSDLDERAPCSESELESARKKRDVIVIEPELRYGVG